MSKSAATICKKVNKDVKSQAMTLARAVLAMQEKIDAQIPVYEELPLAQTLTTTQGEKALKNNPAMQEFRGTVRDYAASLKSLQAILDDTDDQCEVSSLDDIRSRFRVAK